MEEAPEIEYTERLEECLPQLFTTTDETTAESDETNKNTESSITPEHHTNEQKSAKKRAFAEKPQVYGYMKKKILYYLEENGCSSKSVNNVIAASKFNKEAILEYMNERMHLAQKNVHEECESMSFNNIQSWLKLFKEWNLPDDCIYEPALVINAIADNEDMPEPGELNGVDLRSVYKFLGNALLGLPQPKLSTKSAEFLAKEFEILVAEANTGKGDKETRRLNQHLKTYTLPSSLSKEKRSVDPLSLADDMKLN